MGILPKPFKKDSPKAKCPTCNGFHGMPAAHLDYVGHAAVTDRLLSVDPEWSWEPFALDPNGLPALDARGNLWIRLTVCGVTRPGVGDGFSLKEVIGDAIRNAAMRFGVALDLWGKEELEQAHGPAHQQPPQPTPAGKTASDFAPVPHAPQEGAQAAPDTETREMIRRSQVVALMAAFDAAGMSAKDTRLAYCSNLVGRTLGSSNDLSKREGSMVLNALKADAADGAER